MAQDGEAGDRSEAELRARLAEIDAAVEQHDALLRSQQMEEMDRARQWYLQNADDLRLAIEALNEKNLGMRLFLGGEVAWDDEESRAYFVELGRRWHNYVASAMTIADHMGHLFRVQPDDLKHEYEAKLDELIRPHGVLHFVHRSRNVALHRGVFNMAATWRFQSGGKQWFEITCRTDVLLNRYKTWWNAGAKNYLRAKSPQLNLAEVMDEYGDVVDGLWNWYEDRFYEYHYPVFAEFDALANEYRQINAVLEPETQPLDDEPAQFAAPDTRRKDVQKARAEAKKKRSRSNAARKRKRR